MNETEKKFTRGDVDVLHKQYGEHGTRMTYEERDRLLEDVVPRTDNRSTANAIINITHAFSADGWNGDSWVEWIEKIPHPVTP